MSVDHCMNSIAEGDSTSLYDTAAVLVLFHKANTHLAAAAPAALLTNDFALGRNERAVRVRKSRPTSGRGGRSGSSRENPERVESLRRSPHMPHHR